MKKIILFILLMLPVAVRAQKDMPGLYAMPKLGVNIAWINNMDQLVARWTAGIEFDLIAKNVFGISTGVNLTRQGNNSYIFSHYASKHVIHEIDYIAIPVIVAAHVVRGLSLKVGIQPAFVTYSSCVENSLYRNQSFSFKDYYGKDINNVDVSALIGIAYTFPNGITLEERVCIGGTKILDNKNWHNYACQFTIGFKTKFL